MKRLLVRLLGMTVILATAAAPAQAAGELELSLDGTTWTQSIAGPLFDESMRWVPGDSETASFFIRNNGGSNGTLTVDILSSQFGDLLDSGDLHITARGGGGDWTDVSDGAQHRLLSATDVAEGEVAEIKVDVSFDAASNNSTQLRAADLNFRVTLSESLPVNPTGLGDNDGGDGEGAGDNNDVMGLPGTGAMDVRWFLTIGAILVGVGLAFVSRRREEGEGNV